MAVEIPVIVDIEQAFKDAAKRVPQAIEPLEKQISKKTLNVKVDVGTAKHPQLRKFKDLLNESQSSATELERAISAVNKQIHAMQKAGGFKAGKDLKTSERDLIALRAALETKLESGSFIDSAVDKVKAVATGAASAEKSATTAIRNTNNGLRTQEGLLGKIMGRLSAYTAIFAGLRLLRNVRETTAEFEMQRVALGGIIQDATKANQLFGQIKAAAVESPFEIKDLVSFTKQLSAYRIETDKLFDVTMRLADVSAGLGVDMSRLVLAYGQVRAASVLRGQELRQFTEAGIPLVDLLAKKFTQLRGEMVSTGEVFELISERAVPFAMIEEIFNDMTSAGGIFYQMQLKQSETLKGQWMKLKDVISIAYDEMGRTALVNQAMTGWIHLISDLVKSWERIASVVNVAIYSYLAYQAAVKRLIPFYNMQQRSIERQIKLEKQQQIEQIKLASKTDQLTKADQRRIAQIKKMTAEDLKRIYAMDKMSQSQAMMFYWRNKDNKEVVKAITQTGILTKTQMNAIKNMNTWQIHLKTWGSSIRTFFKTIGTAISSFWPIAAVAALITVITSLIQKNKEQEEAIRKVDKAYSEQEQNLLSIENAYRKIQKAIMDVADEQSRAAKEAASFGEKLAYAQKIVEALKKFGLGGDFDLSLLNTENIDDFVETWLGQLNIANELTRDWGRNLAQVANAWEASILGIHFAGDNLNTDIKQLTNAYVKMTSNKAYRENVGIMRNYIETLSLSYEEYYKRLSAILKEDAKLAVSQKRRNETEYQYQMRLIKNYEKIRQFAASDELAFTKAAKAFKPMNDALVNFESKLDEVEREFDKTWGSMKDHDEITIKMAIDKMFAENQWEDWLKEAWIERVNGKYQMNIQMTPTIAQVNVPKGMKGIIATEFAGLFTEQELENMSSVSEIGKAIEGKMKNAAAAIAEADKQANNLANSDLWAAQTKEKIQRAQLTIDAELAKEEKDRNQYAINEAIALIDALTRQNTVYDEQIQKKKESAKAEYELAKAAKERLFNENLSDMGKDIKQAFPGLLKDAYREATDENYVSRFLISDEDLSKINDGVDAYDLWAKNMKAIADEREKMAEAGVTDLTVADEQARLDAQRIEIEQRLAEIDKEIVDWNYEEAKAQYDNLRLAVQQATTKDARLKAESELAKFVEATNFDERAILVIERQRLETQLGITNAALGAKNAILNTFSAMDEAEDFWKEFGKRYNFTLKDKPTGGSGQDPWIILIKNRMKFMQDFQKGVEDLDKFMAHSASLGREQGIMKGRGLSVGIDTDQLKGDAEELRKWYSDAIDSVVKKIRSMGGKQFAGLGVTEILAKDLTGRKIQKYQELLQELWKGLTDFDTSKIKESLDKALKRVSDELRRSETARNFYKNILGLTGDDQLAETLSLSVYGEIGNDFKDRVQKELYESLKAIDPKEVTGGDSVLQQLLGDVATLDWSDLEANLDKLPEKVQGVINRLRSETEKYEEGQAQAYARLLMKFDETRQQEVNIENEYANAVNTINDGLAKHKAAILEDEKIENKEAAIKMAEDRADAAKRGAELERDLGISRLQKDYRLFFGTVGLMSDEAARKVVAKQKEILYKQFLDDGNYVKYNREIKALNEQLEKYTKNKGLLVSYLTEGFDGVSSKISEYANNLRGLAGSITNDQGVIDVSPQSIEFINKLGMIFGGKAFGVSGRKNVWDKLMDQFKDQPDKIKEAFVNAANEMESKAQNFQQAMFWVDFWVNLAGGAISALGEIASYNKKVTDEFSDGWNTAAHVILDVMSLGAADTFLHDSGDQMDRLIALNEKAMSGFQKFKSGDIVGSLVDNVLGWAEVFGVSTKKIDREIKVQSETIEKLDYQYNRLEVSIQKAFGSDYIANYNKQLDVLYAKQAAYLEQARLEESKDKKKDPEKIKEYQKQARDVADQIADMQSQLAEFFTGTDLTSAAKDFATAWIDAYKEFGSTTDAIKEKFNAMIQEMVTNSLAARIMQEILQPLFSQIDEMAADGELSGKEIAAIAAATPKYIEDMNNAMSVLMSGLTAEGYNFRQQVGQFTGIKRNIANATEESVNGLTQAMNVNNFYMSTLPTISANVAQILAIISGGTAENPSTGASYQLNNELAIGYLSALPSIDEKMATMLLIMQKFEKTISDKNSATNLNVIAVRA